MNLRLMLIGGRPRTLVAAVVPVAVGSATAVDTPRLFPWWHSLLALGVALCLQLGVNYANDYSDGVRGTDGPSRQGPLRLVGSRLASPRVVLWAALLSLTAAAALGAILAYRVGIELLIVGLLCIIAAWTYTGGPRPYGYAGFGELFVFVFFGLVATAGTNYVLTLEITGLAVASGVVVGFWATSLLVVNNLRDLRSDAEAGKVTLAVRLGAMRTRNLFVFLQVGALVLATIISIVELRFAMAAFLGLPLVVLAIWQVKSPDHEDRLRRALFTTALIQLACGLAMAFGIAFSGWL